MRASRVTVRLSCSLGFFALCLLTSGCSAIVDAGRTQCSTDADCTKRGAAFANTQCVASQCLAADAWSCADHATLVAKSSAKIPVDFTLFDAVSQKPVVGAEAALCGKLDIECSSPMSTVRADADGAVHFEVAPLFDGYVQLTGDGYDHTLVFLPRAVSAISLGAFPLTSGIATAGLQAQLGKPLIPGTGRILARIADCEMADTAGVSLSGENMGDDAAGFYSVSGLPSFTATATDDSGFAGFLNVAPGSITLTAQLEGGRKVSRVSVLIRPDYVTIRRIQPWTD
jgi:hypothetical protein